jgi:hypothetical protein
MLCNSQIITNSIPMVEASDRIHCRPPITAPWLAEISWNQILLQPNPN